MHIPDGYLNIPTCAATYGVMLPVWYVAGRKLKKTLRTRQIPLLAFGAAFSFVLMMFNFPVVGGSSGHAVGGALLAILLGPWAAVSVLSVVIAIQALLFHDGGLTTFGANALSMGCVLPFVSYMIYKAFADQNSTIFRKGVAGAFAGYVGLSTAALVTGILLGIQPHGAAGYSPYPLSVTIPAMVGSHLLVFSWVEGLATGLVLVWVEKNFPEGAPRTRETKSLRPLWLVVLALIALSPLGLLASGTAFGEWGEAELTKLFGFVPAGISRFSHLWTSPLAGYRLSGHSLAYGYIFSAVIGAAAAACFAYVIGKFLAREETAPAPRRGESPGRASLDNLPSWLLKKEQEPAVAAKEKTTAIQDALHRIGDFLSHVFVLEEIQRAGGFLQKRDPRMKIAALTLFVVLAAWLRNPWLLAFLLALAFALASFSAIPVSWFFRAVFLTMAAFSLIIALPAAFSWITPGRPLLTIYWPYLVVTREGAWGAMLFILRTATAVSFSALLTLTTPWTKLLKALQVFKVPAIFLFIVEMAYRYIFLFVRLLEQIGYAKKSRTIAPMSIQKEQGWTAGRMAFLLQRSIELSDLVYGAMTARGYDGTVRTLDRFSLDTRDKIFGAAAALVCSLLVFLSIKGWPA